MLFRAIDQSDAPAAGQLLIYQRSQIGKSHHWLLGLAIAEGSGANDQRAIGDSLGQSR